MRSILQSSWLMQEASAVNCLSRSPDIHNANRMGDYKMEDIHSLHFLGLQPVAPFTDMV